MDFPHGEHTPAYAF